MVGISALNSLQFSDSVDRLDRKGIWPIKTCTTYPQRFSSGTNGGRKLRGTGLRGSPSKRLLKQRWCHDTAYTDTTWQADRSTENKTLLCPPSLPQGSKTLWWACLYACPLKYLKNHMFKLHKIFLYMLPVFMIQSSSDNNAICYVFWFCGCLCLLADLSPLAAANALICDGRHQGIMHCVLAADECIRCREGLTGEVWYPDCLVLINSKWLWKSQQTVYLVAFKPDYHKHTYKISFLIQLNKQASMVRLVTESDYVPASEIIW